MSSPRSAVTLEQVADAAGVTTMTLARYFRTPEKVAAATRARIAATIDALGYVRNASAAQLAGASRPAVVTIAPALELPFMAEIFAGVSEAAEERQAAVMLWETRFNAERQEQVIEQALSWRPTGIVFLGDTLSARSRRMIDAQPSRFVEAWAKIDNPVDMSIGVSNRAAMQRAANGLMAAGYGLIAYGGRRMVHIVEAQREAGYRDAMAASGRAPVVLNIATNQSPYASGADLLRRLTDGANRPDAILFAGDQLAMGALFEAQRLGIAVPDELAICGFGNYEIAGFCAPSLSTVALPYRAIGRAAVEACFGGKADRDFPVRLVERQTARLVATGPGALDP